MIPEWLNLIDVLFVVVVLLVGMGGFQRGFAVQIAHLALIGLLGIALFFFYPPLFSYFGQIFRNLNESYLAWMILGGFAVLGLLFFFGVRVLLAKMLKTKISEKRDQVYGLLLGLLRGVFGSLLALVLLVTFVSGSFYEQVSKDSYVGKFVCNELSPRIHRTLDASPLGEKVESMRGVLMEQEDGGAAGMF